jgi:hypothetical protein
MPYSAKEIQKYIAEEVNGHKSIVNSGLRSSISGVEKYDEEEFPETLFNLFFGGHRDDPRGEKSHSHGEFAEPAEENPYLSESFKSASPLRF